MTKVGLKLEETEGPQPLHWPEMHDDQDDS